MTTLWDLVADSFDPPERDYWGELGVQLQPKQQLAEDLAAEVDEILFGGAVGGGKSYWGLPHCVVEMLRHPGNRGLILRRVRPSLTRTLWPRAHQLLTGLGKPNEQRLEWHFPNGSVLEFAGVESEMDVHRYQGAEYGVIFFEELTEFSEYQYTYMMSRARAPVPGVRPHIIATTNPGGAGHSWVKRRFVRPDEFTDDGDRVIPEGVTVEPFVPWLPCPNEDQPAPMSRVFVPSTLDDNEALKARDPGYASRAAAGTSAGMRKALTSGDWDAIDAIEGALWSMAQIEADRVQRGEDGRWLPEGAQLVRTVTMVDPAVTHGEKSDDTGIVTVAKVMHEGVSAKPTHHGYVLADDTCHLDPDGWSRTAVLAAHRERSDGIGVEIDNGGDMNLSVLNNAQRQMLADGEITRLIPVFPVRARTIGSKLARAKPVAQLSSHHRLHMVGTHARLEDQLSTWIPEITPKSPDRVDAMVHAVISLGLAPAGKPVEEPKPPSEDELFRRRHSARGRVAGRPGPILS